MYTVSMPFMVNIHNHRHDTCGYVCLHVWFQLVLMMYMYSIESSTLYTDHAVPTKPVWPFRNIVFQTKSMPENALILIHHYLCIISPSFIQLQPVLLANYCTKKSLLTREWKRMTKLQGLLIIMLATYWPSILNTIYRISWVEINGTKCNPGNVIVLEASELFPTFGVISDIVSSDGEFYFVCKLMFTICFSHHFNAYEVCSTNDYIVCCQAELADHYVLSQYTVSDKHLIPLKHHLTCITQ